jgi:hypothetical protein
MITIVPGSTQEIRPAYRVSQKQKIPAAWASFAVGFTKAGTQIFALGRGTSKNEAVRHARQQAQSKLDQADKIVRRPLIPKSAIDAAINGLRTRPRT